jgi:pyruvate/2-oxoglutarate dehydrogenase complex dihydrolipoamide dehydrogenase (E3) component
MRATLRRSRADLLMNASRRQLHRRDHCGVPSVALTLPSIAAVGLGEAEARPLAETVYGFKTLIEEGSERILGAHLVGPHAPHQHLWSCHSQRSQR